jgi:tetratricopeptide (TPR) repeat protein
MLNAGYYADVENKARALVGRHPTIGFPWKMLGVSLMMQGKDALSAWQRATQLSPDDAEAHGNLGKALHDRGRLADAVASYRRTLEIEPELPEVLLHLGNALGALGKIDEAVESFSRLLKIRPDYPEAHCNLGNALRILGQLDAAEASCRRALQLKPALPEAHHNLGNALLDLGRLDEAAASYRNALTLKPDYPAVLTNLGKVLRSQGRAAEAEASCRRAIEIKPDSAETIAFLGEIYADKGQFAEAESLFKRAISIEPALAEGWIGIARYRRMTGSDSSWLASAQRLLAKGLPPQHEIQLRFAIGKYFDDLQDFERAFASYQHANELTKRYGSRYDRHQATQYVDQIILAFDKDWFSQTRTYATESSRPVFIVGMPRSGTSLVEQILASHPAVFGAGELGFWSDASLAYASSTRKGSSGASMLSPLANEYLTLLEQFSGNALRVVDKMPTNFLNLGLIYAVLPNARIIHVHRNPIDTCLSIYFQHFTTGFAYANDLENLAHFYSEYVRIMRHWRSTFPEGVMMDLPYEGLVDDQEAWSRSMLDFIGLQWDPHCIDFHQTHRTVTSASKWQVRQKINKSSIERWRNYEGFITALLTLVKEDSLS